MQGTFTQQDVRARTTTAAWLQEWNLEKPLQNPPNAADYPIAFSYVRAYAIYIYGLYSTPPPPRRDELHKLFRKRICATLHTIAIAAIPVRGIRIETLHPSFNWPQIWRNLHDAPTFTRGPRRDTGQFYGSWHIPSIITCNNTTSPPYRTMLTFYAEGAGKRIACHSAKTGWKPFECAVFGLHPDPPATRTVFVPPANRIDGGLPIHGGQTNLRSRSRITHICTGYATIHTTKHS
jgi:hypothetical protein